MKKNIILGTLLFLLSSVTAFASEADLKIPDLSADQNNMLLIGIAVCAVGLLFGIIQFFKVKKLRAHQSMLDVAQIIYETCKTYLNQQGKFIAILFVFIAICIGFYFGFLNTGKQPYGFCIT